MSGYFLQIQLFERIINDEDSAGKVDFEKEGMLEITHQTGNLDNDDSMFSDFSDAEIHVGDWVKCRKNSVEKWSLGKVIKKGPLMIQTQGWEEPENFPLVVSQNDFRKQRNVIKIQPQCVIGIMVCE